LPNNASVLDSVDPATQTFVITNDNIVFTNHIHCISLNKLPKQQK
jgi:hypothetical protein